MSLQMSLKELGLVYALKVRCNHILYDGSDQFQSIYRRNSYLEYIK